MSVIKMIAVIVYIIIGIALLVLSLVQSKQENGASAAIMGGTRDSFYEKNKNRTQEARMDNAIVALLAVFVILSLALYFI